MDRISLGKISELKGEMSNVIELVKFWIIWTLISHKIYGISLITEGLITLSVGVHLQMVVIQYHHISYQYLLHYFNLSGKLCLSTTLTVKVQYYAVESLLTSVDVEYDNGSDMNSRGMKKSFCFLVNSPMLINVVVIYLN